MEEGVLALTQWLSPAFPVGGFAYSHGLEWAMASGDVTGSAGLEVWLADVLRSGGGASDACLVVAAMAADADHRALDDLARALCPAAERWVETRDQGAAFSAAVNAATGSDDPAVALPVAVGRAAGRLALAPELVAALYLQAFATNLVLAAVRFLPLGAGEGQRIVTALRQIALDAGARAAQTRPEDIRTATFGVDLAAMRHKCMETRIFRT